MNNMYGLGTYGASSFVDTFFGTSSTSGGSLLSSIGDLQMIQKGAYKKAMKAYVAKLKSSDSAETIKNSGTADSGTKLSGLKSSSQKLYQAANDLKNASYGDNTKAALITRGIAEIARLGTKMGAHMETFYGLSGMGDLIVTCASVHSRNRKAGYLMGKGYTMQQAMDEVKMVVEGVYSAKAAKSLAEKYDMEMPIIMEVNKVLFEDKPAADAVRDLMIRDKKVEAPMLPW